MVAKKRTPAPQKRKASKDQPVGFIELAHRMGYDPGQLLIERRNELADVLRRLEAGENVPEWTGMGHRATWVDAAGRADMVSTVNKIIGRLRREIMEMDIELLPYRYAKPKSVEVSGEGGGPVEMVIRWEKDSK